MLQRSSGAIWRFNLQEDPGERAEERPTKNASSSQFLEKHGAPSHELLSVRIQPAVPVGVGGPDFNRPIAMAPLGGDFYFPSWHGDWFPLRGGRICGG